MRRNRSRRRTEARDFRRSRVTSTLVLQCPALQEVGRRRLNRSNGRSVAAVRGAPRRGRFEGPAAEGLRPGRGGFAPLGRSSPRRQGRCGRGSNGRCRGPRARLRGPPAGASSGPGRRPSRRAGRGARGRLPASRPLRPRRGRRSPRERLSSFARPSTRERLSNRGRRSSRERLSSFARPSTREPPSNRGRRSSRERLSNRGRRSSTA